ncbi:FimB/Mfa2 family fimbrial subunit [Xylanibacter muris]|uniref:FimB/Mfa2 family fimbrial subunit n=1 Tax=Xylanibacter muris TaxID=2736290 RepID=A0ABX2ARN6_9BACT|nr:FimB/Mfa2 family fimbrial subunit [Xylanibacter muris]NPD92890.1 FimB/Mfa2 family fimbrial subunit [Xylanibacter muris]
MKIIKTYIKRNALHALMTVMAVLPLVAFMSCDSIVYDYEGDCSVTYRLKFRYDKNLKWADAFANEVSSVHVYAFDQSGVLVWQCEEQIAPATAEDYSMSLDLPAGDYRLLAWCGLRNDGRREESFSVPEARVGETRMEELRCMLNRKHDETGAYSKDRLYRLFHGTLDVSLPTNNDGGSYEYTMSLTKNTNHIRVILQHLSEQDVNKADFTFRIDDENGLMAHDNELMADENINYRPWDIQNVEAGIGKDANRAVSNVKGLVADFTVGRLIETHNEKMILSVTTKEGRTVARIPVIDYALMGKEYYENEYHYPMDEREFLDRLDECVMTLFLDENHEWVSSVIQILSWRVVLSNVEV